MKPLPRKARRPATKTPSRPARLPKPARSPRRALGVALAGAVLLGGAWLAWRSHARIRAPARNVLLITVDTLRADALGCYGNAAAATPWMDRLAAGGVRFEAAHAQNVLTLPSHANILSGRYPFQHGVRDNAGFRFPAGMDTLATLLKARGYRTGAFVSAFPLDARFGLARGFDVYDASFVGASQATVFLEQQRSGVKTVALARRFLDAQGAEPSFCWVHVFEPHFPYDPPEPFASRFRSDPYAGEVAAADAALGPLIEPLLAAGARGGTLVVLTGDHGESLGEHGEATHGIFAYEATLRVPLILYAPGLLAPRVVRGPARHIDILPTLLDALKLPVPAGLPGRSLLPLARGAAAAPVTSYFEALSGPLLLGSAPLRGVIRGGLKYVDLPIPELYDLSSDPHERRDLARDEPARVAEMKALLAPFLADDPGLHPRPEGADASERLRSLGYLGGGAAPTRKQFSVEDDPKRLIGLDRLLQEVVSRTLAGDPQGALESCRQLVRLRPEMPAALLQLAHLQRETGDLQSAVATLRKLVAAHPADATAAALLGRDLTEAGEAAQAAELLAPYARRPAPDLEVLVARGLALAKLGHRDEALAELQRAREIDPRNATLLVDSGTVRLMGNDTAGARRDLEAALAENPNLARAESSLAFLDAESGRSADALRRFRRALSLDPGECGRLLALGALLVREGRGAEARDYLELFVAKAPPRRYARELEQARAWLAGRAASAQRDQR
jgi:arylsulfatase A-like enzyme/Flp pilus assembly protein TadD